MPNANFVGARRASHGDDVSVNIEEDNIEIVGAPLTEFRRRTYGTREEWLRVSRTTTATPRSWLLFHIQLSAFIIYLSYLIYLPANGRVKIGFREKLLPLEKWRVTRWCRYGKQFVSYNHAKIFIYSNRADCALRAGRKVSKWHLPRAGRST